MDISISSESNSIQIPILGMVGILQTTTSYPTIPA